MPHHGPDRMGKFIEEVIKEVKVMDGIGLGDAHIRPGPLESHEMAVSILDFTQFARLDQLFYLERGRVIPVDVSHLKNQAPFFSQGDHLSGLPGGEGDRFLHKDILPLRKTFSGNGQMVVSRSNDIHPIHPIEEISVIG